MIEFLSLFKNIKKVAPAIVFPKPNHVDFRLLAAVVSDNSRIAIVYLLFLSVQKVCTPLARIWVESYLASFALNLVN
jgi:hypothetical protein